MVCILRKYEKFGFLFIDLNSKNNYYSFFKGKSMREKFKFGTYIFVGVIFLLMASHQSHASDESDKAEVDAGMISASKQANDQLVGTKVDEYTKIRYIGFDKKIPVYIYVYSTSIMSKLGSDQISSEQKRAMDVFHINKTCGTNFRPLMNNPYNLKVSHEFEDSRTGKLVYKIIIGSRDCPK